MMVIAMTGCTRIPTGEVGLRIKFDKTTETVELPAGSFNQTIVGAVLKFPIKAVAAEVENLTPIASDNSTMKDFDTTIVYNINPSSVPELYSKQSRSFHAVNTEDETLLMYSYMQLIAKNAIFKVARKYESLKMNDARQAIEGEIMQMMQETLKQERLESALIISQVQVKSISPADAIKESADNLVKAQNAQKQKEVEVGTAELEAKRIAVLNANAGAIGYMNAMAQMKIAEGIANGKVQTVVIPYDFKGMVNVGK